MTTEATRHDLLPKSLTAQEFIRFRDAIHLHAGIWLEESKADSLRISLVSRATRHGITDYDAYYELLVSDESEFRALINLITINETSFYRFPAQFAVLKDRIVPELIRTKSESNKRIRAWSAGCSTGEEPYTVATTLLDSGLEGLGYEIDVLGTDVSTTALDRARDARYPLKALESVDPRIARTYFESDGERVTPIKRVRDIVDFSYNNLIKEPYTLGLSANWDVIFCRNVTIYFRPASTRRVVHNFYESLNPGGYLLIGHSETLAGISDEFDTVELDGVFVYRKPVSGSAFSARAARREQRREAQQQEPASTEDAEAKEGIGQQLLPARLAEAHAALDRGEPRIAIQQAELVVSADPLSVEGYLVLAFAHADTGDFDAATVEAQRALEIDPLVASAHYIIGVISLRQGLVDRAVEEFKRTRYLDSDFVLAYLSLGNIYRQRGDSAEALSAYEAALKALDEAPSGEWTRFAGGFSREVLARTCTRGIEESKKHRNIG